MKNIFQSLRKHKRDILQIVMSSLSIGVFFLSLYFLSEYIDKIQCCTHYSGMGEFGGWLCLLVFFQLLLSYTVFRLTSKNTTKVSTWQKIFLSMLGVVLYSPVVGLAALWVAFSWYDYSQHVDVGIFEEKIVGGIFIIILSLLLAYLNYKYILFRKYTFRAWLLVSTGVLGFLLFIIFDDKYIFSINRIILILANLIFIAIIIFDRYKKEISLLSYLIIIEITTFLFLIINFATGLFLQYNYTGETVVDFWQCELNKKEWLVPRTIGTAPKGLCLNAEKACRIIDKKKTRECKKSALNNRLTFIKSDDWQFILDEYNNKKALSFKISGVQRGVVIWQYHGITRVTPILSSTKEVHFFKKDGKKGQYLTDGKYIYYGNRQAQANIDLDTFEYLGWRCARDKNNFLYQGRVATEKERLSCLQYQQTNRK